MIQNLRKGRASKIIMWIVLVTFIIGMGGVGFWGIIRSIFTGGGSVDRTATLAVVGKEKVDTTDYKMAYLRIVNQMDPEAIAGLQEDDFRKLAKTAWEEAVNDAVWVQVIEKEKATAGSKELDEILKFSPPPQLLQDTGWYVNGQFNIEMYHQMLAAPDLPEQTRAFLDFYRQELGREVEREKVRQDVINSFRATSLQLADASDKAGTQMTLEALFVYELPQADTNVSQEEIEKFYEENIDVFEREKWWELRMIGFPILPSVSDSMFVKERLEDALAAIDAGYDFEQVAQDFTRDSSQLITRPVDRLDAVEYEHFSSMGGEDTIKAYLYRGAWHLTKIETRTGEEVTYREINFPIKAGGDTRREVLNRIEEFRKEAKKGDIDSLVVKYKVNQRHGPFVQKSKDTFLPQFPYDNAIKTYAVKSKVGDVSEPFPEFKETYFVFATVDIKEDQTMPLDSANIAYCRRRIIQQRREDAQTQYASQLRQKVASGVDFALLAEGPHLSIDTLEFSSYFEAETRYGALMAGECYALQEGQLTGPVKCDIGYGYFRCLSRVYDPEAPLVSQAVQNEQTILLNAIADQVFDRGEVKDYRRAYNFVGSD